MEFKIITIHPDITKTNFYRNADFNQDDSNDSSFIFSSEISSIIKNILEIRDGIAITEVKIEPQNV